MNDFFIVLVIYLCQNYIQFIINFTVKGIHTLVILSQLKYQNHDS